MHRLRRPGCFKQSPVEGDGFGCPASIFEYVLISLFEGDQIGGALGPGPAFAEPPAGALFTPMWPDTRSRHVAGGEDL